MLLRSRIVLPLRGRPIENGSIRINGRFIAEVGRRGDVSPAAGEPVLDLGESILLPGLINAHCHLDYTGMAGMIPSRKHFADWIKAIVALKGSWGYSEFAQSWVRGARMLVDSGTTTVADVEAVPELLPDAWHLGPLRIISFREMISLKWNAAAQQQFDSQVKSWAALPHRDGTTGLSPHAPYTTTPELLHRAANTARNKNWLLTTHLAESEDEFQMFHDGTGPLTAWLGPQRDPLGFPKSTPVQYAEACGYLNDRLIAVHANYLDGEDVQSLARRGVSVVHCPRSHAYFGHRVFAFETLRDAGVNLCLGTDSLASIRKNRKQSLRLSWFDEMHTFMKRYPDVAPADVLNLVTLNPARALKKAGQLGELTTGACADIISIPFSGPVAKAVDHVVHFSGDVAASMIDGQWAMEPK